MKKLLLIVLLLPLFFSCGHSVDDSEILSLISEAESLFKKALEKEEPVKSEYFFRSAVLLEEAIERGEINNGYIFYNAGNSWMNIGETGKAVLNYKKALKRLPNNDLVKDNLAQARNSVTLEIEEDSINPLVRTIFFFHYDLSFRGRTIVLIALSFLVFSTATALLFFKRNYLRSLLYAFILFFTIFSVSLFAEMLKDTEGVVLSETEGRKGDSAGYEKSFTTALSPGIEFTLLEERSEWIFIRLRDGRTCWIPEASAGFID